VKTVVLLSGGLDSAVALALQLQDGHEVCALTVDYGQRHAKEIGCANRIAAHYKVRQQVAAVDPVLFRGSALTGRGAVPVGVAPEPDATYVPARNTVLLALGAAYAESVGAQTVVIGANADDAAAYPDCRPAYLEAMRDVLLEGTVGHVWVSAPLLYWRKDQIVESAKELGVPIGLTWSCYVGGDEPCGVCGACQVVTA
jgi:7-cyano-7-deazaguanine synthase